MVKPQWHDRLRHELRERGLPPTYSARLIEELTDHFTDIQKENMSMEAQTSAEEKLGSPELLASAAQKAFGGRTFAGRHPIMTFLIGPIPLLFVTWYAIVGICGLCKGFVTPMEPAQIDPPTAFEWVVAYGCVYVSRFLPFVLAAWLFTRLGSRAKRPAWGLVACGIVAYFAFTFWMNVAPPTEQYSLRIVYTFLFGLRHWQRRLAQAILPLAFGLWTWYRMTYPTKNSPWRGVSELSSAPTHA